MDYGSYLQSDQVVSNSSLSASSVSSCISMQHCNDIVLDNKNSNDDANINNMNKLDDAGDMLSLVQQPSGSPASQFGNHHHQHHHHHQNLSRHFSNNQQQHFAECQSPFIDESIVDSLPSLTKHNKQQSSSRLFANSNSLNMSQSDQNRHG